MSDPAAPGSRPAKPLFLPPAAGTGGTTLIPGSAAAAPEIVVGGFPHRTGQEGGGNQLFQVITPAIGTLHLVLLPRQFQSFKYFSTVAALVLKNRHFSFLL